MNDETTLGRHLTDLMAATAPGRAPDRMLTSVLAGAAGTAQRSRLRALVAMPAMRLEGRPVAGSGGLRAGTRMLTVGVAALAVAGVGVIGVASLPVARVPAEQGAFELLAATLSTVREGPTLLGLRDGRVLVIGGYPGGTTMELFDPATETFSAGMPLMRKRLHPEAIQLLDGRVLIVGQEPTCCSASEMIVELFDPETGTSEAAGVVPPGLGPVEASHEPDGRVRLEGPAGAWLWDPGTHAFEPTDPWTLTLRTGTPLPDGRWVQVHGDRVFAWNSRTDETTVLGSLVEARSAPAVAPLPDGRVLVAGGGAASGGVRGTQCGTRTAELFDPIDGTSTVTGQLAAPRTAASAIALQDGRVLIAGGWWSCPDADTAELFTLGDAPAGP